MPQLVGGQARITGFDPRSIPGCTIWLDGGDPNGNGVLPTPGSSITTWVDKSGNGKNATSQTSPGAIASNYGGYNSLYFNRAPWYKTSAFTLSNSLGTTWFCVSVITGNISLSAPVFSTTGPERSMRQDGGSFQAYTVNNGTLRFYTYAGSATSPSIYSIADTPSSLTWFSNTSQASQSNTAVTYQYNTSQIGQIGYWNDYFLGHIFEILIYDAPLTIPQRQQIEGYLAWKWGLQAGLYVSKTIPTSIPGCRLWLDASDSSTITTSGGNMTQWTDKSGTGNTMTAYSTYSNATVSAAYQNGLNVLNFSGAVYKAPASSAVYPLDVYIVLALKDTTTVVDVMSINTNTSTDNFNSLTFGEYTASRWHNGSTGFTRTPNTVAAANETSTSFLLINWSIADSNYILRRNGTQLTQTTSYTFGLTSGSIFQIGLRYGTPLLPTPDHPFKGYIGEILAFNSQLGTSQRQQIEGYLAWKWGLQSSLPDKHPYVPSIPVTHPHYPLRPFARPFQPTDIPSCALWLDVADASTMIMTGTTVTQWNDKSWKGFNCTVAPGGNAVGPIYNSSTTSLEFRASNSNALAIPSGFGTAVIGNTYTGIFVAQRATATGYQPILSGGPIGNCNYIYMGFLNDNIYLNEWVPDLIYALPAYTTPEPRRIYGYDIQSTSNASLLSNGTTLVTTTTVNFIFASTFGYAEIGRSYGQDGYNRGYSTFNVSEILFFIPALTTPQRQQVEGYLAAKWGLNSSLPTTQPFKTIPPSSVIVNSPLSIPGCALWLDAADKSSMSLTGSTITQWNDKSGSSNNFNVTTGTPALITDGSFSVVNIPSGTIMSSVNQITLTTSSALFVVSKSTAVPGASISHILGFTNLGQQYVSGVGIRLYNGILSGTTAANNGDSYDIGNANYYVNGTFNPSNFGSNYYMNTYSLIDTTFLTQGGTTYITFSTSFFSRYFIGNIAECLCYPSGVTSMQRQQIEGYLAAKWNLQSSLPSTHPFSKRPAVF